MIRIDDPTEAPAVVQRIRRILTRAGRNPNEPLLFERFIPGFEVAVEGVVRDGRLEVLAILDKPDALDGPFFEETLYVTPSRLHPDMQAEVAVVTQRAIDALGLRVGPVHAELRVDGPWVRMVEIAARPIGGLCGRALRFGLMGSTLETVLLRAALGMPLRGMRREEPAAGVMMIPIPRNGTLEGVYGIDRATAVPGSRASRSPSVRGPTSRHSPRGIDISVSSSPKAPTRIRGGRAPDSPPASRHQDHLDLRRPHLLITGFSDRSADRSELHGATGAITISAKRSSGVS